MRVDDFSEVRRDFDTKRPAAAVDESGRDLGLLFADVFLAEKELAIQVREIDCVHVDDVEFLETRHREVLQKLGPEATGANNQNPGLGHKLLSYL